MSTPPSATVEVQGLCNYYARTGYYRHIQTVCNEFIKKKPSSPDPALVFWRAYGAMREGSINESIRDLDSIRREGELLFAILVALLHAHQLSKIVDNDEISRLETALAKEQARVGERGLLMAAMFAWHTERLDDASEYVHRLLAMKPGSTQGSILKCWIELASGGAAELDPNAWDANNGRRELEALMGKVKQFETLEQYDKALENLNQVIVTYGWFLPALAEKAKVLMMAGDWEQAIETAQRVLSHDASNIEALRISALFLLSQEAKYAEATQRISDLLAAIERNEPKNALLYESLSRPFARIGGRNPAILKLTHALIDRACKLAPFTASYVVEKGYQFTLLGEYAAAAAAYREAHKLDESDTEAVLGQIRCQVEAGQLREASAQLEFIAAIQESLGTTADLEFVAALVSARHDHDKSAAVEHLDKALELHMGALRKQAHDVSYFVKLNPDFLLELAREYVGHVGTEPEVREASSDEAVALGKALKLLEIVRKQVPGLLEGQMLLARAKYLNHDYDGALRLLAHCARVDPAFVPASLLHAQILLRQDQPKAAHGVLEAALAHNFEVRNSLLYHLVSAHSLASDGELESAHNVLQGALKLPGVREGGPTVRSGTAPTAHERCSTYMQTVDVLLKLDRVGEAAKLMHEAISVFAGTEQEGRITVANCELLLKKGDIEGALAILRSVTQESPNYHRAKVLLAELYLKYRNDRRLYCQCHEELARAAPSVATYVSLGEAYMNVQEPEKAIPAFEQALQRAPNDASLASRIGRALISTHDYVRAIDFYDSAIAADPSKATLKYELAELYLKLGKHELSQETLEDLLDDAPAVTGSGPARPKQAGEKHVQELIRDVGAWQMLARALRERGQIPQAVESLVRARKVQQRVLSEIVADAANDPNTFECLRIPSIGLLTF